MIVSVEQIHNDYVIVESKEIIKNIVYNILTDYVIIIRDPRIEKLSLCTPKILYEKPCRDY